MVLIMKNLKSLNAYLKLLEIRLKTSGTLGYIIYCVLGITVMVIVWGLILGTLGYIFLTPLFSLKYLGEINLLKIIIMIIVVFGLILFYTGKKMKNFIFYNGKFVFFYY